MTTTDCTKSHGRTNRRRILIAARTCFAEVGFQAASMGMIAERAAMSVGAIYRLYGQKSLLIENVVRREIARWIIGARVWLIGMSEVAESLPNTRTTARNAHQRLLSQVWRARWRRRTVPHTVVGTVR